MKLRAAALLPALGLLLVPLPAAARGELQQLIKETAQKYPAPAAE